jgi:predicted DNA-binding protein
MEVDMELSRKTTILLSPALHERLQRLARRRGVSMGELIREACAVQYGVGGTETRAAAVQQLGALQLPVGDPQTLKRESVPDAGELLP